MGDFAYFRLYIVCMCLFFAFRSNFYRLAFKELGSHDPVNLSPVII